MPNDRFATVPELGQLAGGSSSDERAVSKGADREKPHLPTAHERAEPRQDAVTHAAPWRKMPKSTEYIV
jgi:hypothetical protein